jgi:hypothetical protein
MLKTALVRVSYIQNTQIRGETIAKVFGKVDTFWMYHRVAEKDSDWLGLSTGPHTKDVWMSMQLGCATRF